MVQLIKKSVTTQNFPDKLLKTNPTNFHILQKNPDNL